MKHSKVLRNLSASQIILFGFADVIFIGTLLLMLPAASADHNACSLQDALFTATSAVCVTGLVLRDTMTGWSTFGQAVILSLIQTGGLGAVLVLSSVFLLTGRRIGLKHRSTVQDSISAPQTGGVVRLLRFILLVFATSEGLGTLIMFPVFVRDFGAAKGLWFSFFHSVSAMCNAGFDLMGERGAFSSLASYSSNPQIILVISGLIIWGGLGFLTWKDIFTYRLRFNKYSLQSKLIITVTFFLILVPALIFFFFEFSKQPTLERVLNSIFNSVTPRTAGFATIDLNDMSEAGRLLVIVLMLIGGAPGSTAGGMKVTTVGIVILTVVAVFRQERDTEFLNRRIDDETIRSALCICILYLFMFLTAGMLISRIEGFPLLDSIFESASAIGTVGLSLGITPQIGLASKIILILLMYLGRVGGLTLVYAIIPQIHDGNARRIAEKVTVG